MSSNVSNRPLSVLKLSTTGSSLFSSHVSHIPFLPKALSYAQAVDKEHDEGKSLIWAAEKGATYQSGQKVGLPKSFLQVGFVSILLCEIQP